jgi:hypothetical protein
LGRYKQTITLDAFEVVVNTLVGGVEARIASEQPVQVLGGATLVHVHRAICHILPLPV